MDIAAYIVDLQRLYTKQRTTKYKMVLRIRKVQKILAS